MYRKVIKAAANWFGYSYIDGYSAPNIQPFYTTIYQPDKLHPNTNYAPILCNYIASKIQNNDSMELGDETNFIDIRSLADSGVTVSSLGVYFSQDTGEITIQGSVTYTNSTTTARYNFVPTATPLPAQFRPAYYVMSPAYGTLTGEGIPGSIICNANGELYLSLYNLPTTTNSGTCIFSITFTPKFAMPFTNVSI